MGGQYHHELMKYCPPSYVLCVSSHFWPFIIVKVVLEKLDKNLGSADPPPSVGPNSQIFPKIRFEGSPYGPLKVSTGIALRKLIEQKDIFTIWENFVPELFFQTAISREGNEIL